VVFAIAGGLSVTVVGYYTPFMIAGSMIMAIGAGLFLLFRVDIPLSMWYVTASQIIPSSVSSLTHTRLGFQIVFGAGAGIGLELPHIAIQTVLPEEDVSIGTSLVVFARSLGGAIFVSVGQNVFSNHIVSGMLSRVPFLDPSMVLESGATDLQQTVRQATSGQADVVVRILEIYNDAIVQKFVVALALACVSIIGALGVEWRTVKGSPKEQESEQVD
jgi:hypothetical protein